jgi:tRNA(Ile)-lysidine synthase
LRSSTGAELEDYGRQLRVDWITDPSNEDTSFDRNFLRARALPLLAERWPQVRQQLAHSAQLAAQASELTAELAAVDLAGCGAADRLSSAALQALSPARQANLLRHACVVAGLLPPPRRQLAAILQEVLPAREDAAPVVRWQGGELRRYRDHLYLLHAGVIEPAATPALLRPDNPVSLGVGLGALRLQKAAAGGVSPQAAEAGLAVRYRDGGESLRPQGRGRQKSLKKLLQEAGIVPWMRERLPLLYHGDALVAVADLWIAQEFFSADGFRPVWENKPRLL